MLPPTYWGELLCRPCGRDVDKELDRTGWPTPWWECPEAPHVAALGGAGRGCILWGPHTLALPRSLDELGRFAERSRVRQVWIHESALAPLGLPVTLPAARDRHGEAPAFFADHGAWKTPSVEAAAFSRWWRPGGFGFSVCVPSWERDESPFAGAESVWQLRAWVAWYEAATKEAAPWGRSGGVTSDVFIRKAFADPRRSNLRPTERPEPMITGEAREARWFWHRQPGPDDAHFRYCHALDVNSAYAAVASSLPLPVGPVHHEVLPTFDKRRPGLWLVEGTGWGREELPAPWADDQRRDRSGPHWVTTPTMERIDQCGGFPVEAWLWEEHHAYLRPWYELVRDARAELVGAGMVGGPIDAVKALGRRGVGRLASPNRTKELELDELFQPYWAWAIIAECRARIHRRAAALPVAPVAIDTDKLWVLSSRSSPEAFAVRENLPLGDGLGQFHAAGTCSAVDAREALDELRHSTAIRRLRELTK